MTTTYTSKDTSERLAQESEDRLGKMQALLAVREERIAALDTGLTVGARAERIRALGEELIEAATPHEAELLERVKAARQLAEAAEPRRARMMATFDADQTADATQRLAWSQRVGIADTTDLLVFAEAAESQGQLALAGVIEAELRRRSGESNTLSDFEKHTLSRVAAVVGRIESEDGAAVRAAAERAERTFRASQELLRQLRGARPSALHSIREGLIDLRSTTAQ